VNLKKVKRMSESYSFRLYVEDLGMIKKILDKGINLPDMLREYIREIYRELNNSVDDDTYL
jgi:hypothetical protein